jgi:hypothetical protein
LYLLFCIVIFHLVSPVVLVAAAVRKFRRRDARFPLGYAFMVSMVAYVALVANLSEHGENMRFRLSVEPLLWISSAVGLGALVGLVRSQEVKESAIQAEPGLDVR